MAALFLTQLKNGCLFIKTTSGHIKIFQPFKLKVRKYKWDELDGYAMGKVRNLNSGKEIKLCVLFINDKPMYEIGSRDYWRYEEILKIMKTNSKYLGKCYIEPNTLLGKRIRKDY
ncbi:hypothetical protein [Aureibacter tunicatorum]|nr:hypothetical protein [Aureibacter tunicatorum]